MQEAACFAFRFGEAGGDEGVDESVRRRFERNAGHAVLRQLFEIAFRERVDAAGEEALADTLSRFQRGLAVYEFGRLLCEDALRFRLFAAVAVGGFNRFDLGDRQEGEVAQEFVDVGVGGVEPELVEGVG